MKLRLNNDMIFLFQISLILSYWETGSYCILANISFFTSFSCHLILINNLLQTYYCSVISLYCETFAIVSEHLVLI